MAGLKSDKQIKMEEVGGYLTSIMIEYINKELKITFIK